MDVNIAVSKTRKYATSNSGDTVEVVERPQGGVSVVLADGQSSGRGAKSVSVLVVRKVIAMIAEGIRDGAAARAASDSLFTERGGKVSATLNILSIDQQTDTLVITRNNPVPAILYKDNQVQWLSEESRPIGFYRDTRPVISEIPLEPGLMAIVYTDGFMHAGDRYGQPTDIQTCLAALLEEQMPSPLHIADSLLEHAIRLDHGHPSDDISIVVLQVSRHTGDETRRMTVRLPLTS